MTVLDLQGQKYVKAMDNILLYTKEPGTAQPKELNFCVGIQIYLFAETLRLNYLEKRERRRTMTLQSMVNGINRMSIATNSEHCTDFVNGNSKIFDKFFQAASTPKNSQVKESLLSDLSIKNDNHLRQVISILFFYINDIKKGTIILSNNEENKIFRIMMLSIAIKKSLKQLDTLNEHLKD
mmetsp:Transcript_16893/g.16145  ORF Transcript_16893/g.16145 Transcript_16893/m.16145 type:complete len:181 (+) Transcript_16893:540-1082(+)